MICKHTETQFQNKLEKFVKKLSKKMNGIKVGGIVIELSNRVCKRTPFKYLKYVTEDQLLITFANPFLKSEIDNRLFRFFSNYSDAVKITNCCREWITAGIIIISLQC